VVIGVLSALPVINVGNCCCCAWVLFGGGLAAYLMQQNHSEPIQIGDGAVVGLLAGVIGAGVWLVVSVPMRLAFAGLDSQIVEQFLRQAADLPPELRAIIENASKAPTIGIGLLFGFFISLVVNTTFGMLGGLFGALMFKKSPPPVMPPPIPPANTF
jgi:hypothetical protein